ncbi:DUF305 domain-containing protein [Streptosporangium oxazolinicum]|uniref:DUF305 domain-containing protein n=1 Tax=Streptosporangium oxazolinicum TaxID=909287 RepID=UPI0031EAF93C
MGITVAAAIEDRISLVQQPHAPADSDGQSMGWVDDKAVNSEFDYLTQMISHDREAVTAATQLRRSSAPKMRRLGEEIVATQTAEIATMKAWLAKWYPGRSTRVGYQPMMRDLSKLSGDTLDRTFLKGMIPHHKAAVMMSQRLIRHGYPRHKGVAVFARKVRDAKHAEISQMQRQLAAEPKERPTGMIMPATRAVA